MHLGWCLYCKEEVTMYDEYVKNGERIFHYDCYKLDPNYGNEIVDEIDELEE